jgi:hypothetical protein
MRERILYQLSDLPWLLVGGLLGLLIEGLLLATGIRQTATPWIPVLEVVVLYGGVLGFLGFRFGRSATGVLAGAAAGAVWAVLFGVLGWESWMAGAGLWTGLLLRTLIGASLPALTDRIVDPWLLRGPLGRLASHHPRFSHLRR